MTTRLATSTLPEITLVKQPSRSAAIVVSGLAQTGSTPPPSKRSTRKPHPDAAAPVSVGVPADLEKALTKASASSSELAADLGGSAETGSVLCLPALGQTRLVLVGIGGMEVSPDAVRDAAAAAVRTVLGASHLQGDVALSLDITDPELIGSAAIGIGLGAYGFTKIGAQPRELPKFEIVSTNQSREAKESLAEALVVVEAVTLARDLVNTPANLLYPETLASEVVEATRPIKSIKVDVLDEAALAKGGYGGLLAVGGGSARPPRLIRLEYKPRTAGRDVRTLALVGKGITFDSGGLDIKTPSGMYTMKTDMAGAAATFAATVAIAALDLPVHVVTYLAAAENMPSGSAYRPSDVLTMYGGTTVENVNTDAEGRLVMADALSRSNEDEPDLTVDVATLTGAAVVALGERIGALMASDDTTADQVLDAAEAGGEPFWQLPIPEHLARALTKSEVADLKSGGDRYGGALTAAAFLQNFVDEGRHWAHLDIAGPAFNDGGAFNEHPTGATGAAVRTLIALAKHLGA